ncbi:protein YpfM [Salmonella enterica]|nr:protein YpfM [Salmonella enterica]EDB4569083.1 protein YpfM [Salmonella enterica subsp. enterica serovar Panama]EDG5757891.1 protein YpfM [Salmonella enterica subsp. enterica serovar Heidelberg]EED9937588.1 protein YpfM [Salmonella enterica subsp. enterica serovar Anatum]EIH8527068.1 protein YpfM [Escherichia coli]HBC6112230.1 protein YpfM [Citrobacter freundii]HCM6296294.1 protein YpfM [Salmonella enterica subsp. enterica serovar 3:e,h:1,6]
MNVNWKDFIEVMLRK